MADQPGANEEDQGPVAPRPGTGAPDSLGAAEPLTIGRKSGKSGSPGGGSSTPRKKRRFGTVGIVAVIVGVILLAFVPAFVSGLKKTPRNRYGISYGGGPIEGTHYQRIVQPGSALFFNGFYDPLYLYPSDQVNYIISKKPGLGAQNAPDSIVAPTKDRVQATYQVAVYFKLNEAELRAFHEQFGLRYKAYTSTGWYNLIRDTFRQQIENALQEETRKVDVADLFSSAEELTTIQKDVQDALTQKLEAAMGGHFFCSPAYQPGKPCGNPTFLIKKIDVPAAIATSFQQNRQSQIDILTQQNLVQQKQLEAQQKDELGMTGDEWVKYQAVQNGKVKFWILPSGANVTVPSGADGTTSTTKGG